MQLVAMDILLIPHLLGYSKRDSMIKCKFCDKSFTPDNPYAEYCKDRCRKDRGNLRTLLKKYIRCKKINLDLMISTFFEDERKKV